MPIRDTLWSVVLAALSMKLKLAWRVPMACGEKVTLTGRLVPGGSVTGRAIALVMVKSPGLRPAR